MIAGIDIGGMKVRWVVMDKKYRVVMAREAKTPSRPRPFTALLRDIFSEVGKKKVRAIGIGAPGSVFETVLRRARNLPGIVPLDFKNLVPARFSFRLDNDAKCFARAEACLGAGKGARKMLSITVGTGIGRALAVNKKVIPLKRFEEAEIWEPAYQQRTKEAAFPLSIFLARKLATIIFEIQPDLVVIGGGRLRTGGLFKLLRRELQKCGVTCPIRYPRFKKNAAAIGAALLVTKNF